MPVLNLFSYRKCVAEGDMPDVFTYDELPRRLLVQVVHIVRDAIGHRENPGWKWVHDAVARERGLLELNGLFHFNEKCVEYLLALESAPVEEALDFIEASFLYIDRIASKFDLSNRRVNGITMLSEAAIQELNERFRRAGVGYQFDDGQIFRVDSELIHSEVVRPALRYLHQRGFEGPREEFLRGHSCYRAGDAKEAVTNANNAFESTLKTICDQRGWTYDSGATASRLLKVVHSNGLLPDYLDASFDQLAATLKSGLPKVRNEESAHGHGSTPRETPDYVAAFALHLAAAKILFLVEAHKAMQ